MTHLFIFLAISALYFGQAFVAIFIIGLIVLLYRFFKEIQFLSLLKKNLVKENAYLNKTLQACRDKGKFPAYSHDAFSKAVKSFEDASHSAFQALAKLKLTSFGNNKISMLFYAATLQQDLSIVLKKSLDKRDVLYRLQIVVSAVFKLASVLKIPIYRNDESTSYIYNNYDKKQFLDLMIRDMLTVNKLIRTKVKNKDADLNENIHTILTSILLYVSIFSQDILEKSLDDVYLTIVKDWMEDENANFPLNNLLVQAVEMELANTAQENK